LTVIDIEQAQGENGEIDLYGSSGLLATINISNMYDGEHQTPAINASGVTQMTVFLGGSGAVDNIQISVEEPPPPPGEEGCTPGYWKNHLDSWAAAGYSPGQTVASVFSAAAANSQGSDSLLAALNYGGGPGAEGAAKILLHPSVAALLNGSHPDVSSTYSVASIIADVNAALASGNRDTMLSLASSLDAANNLGCPGSDTRVDSRLVHWLWSCPGGVDRTGGFRDTS
jgi:hypothetical protein